MKYDDNPLIDQQKSSDEGFVIGDIKYTPLDFVASKIEKINDEYTEGVQLQKDVQSQKDDIDKLWGILTDIIHDFGNNVTNSDYFQAFLKKVVDYKSLNEPQKEEARKLKEEYKSLKEKAKEKIASWSPFGKKPEGAAPATTTTGATATATGATTATEGPKKKGWFSWGGRKSRKQSKSKKQRKSRKQRKTRK